MKIKKIKTHKYFYLFFCLFFIFQYKNIHFAYSQDVSKNQIHISGKFKNVKPPAYLCLYDNDLKGFVLLDSIPLNKTGNFSFIINTDETKFLFLKTAKDDLIKLIASPEEDIILEGSYDNLLATYTINGSKDSEILKQIDQKAIENDNKVKQLGNYFANADKSNIKKLRDSLDKVFKNIQGNFKSYLENVIKENSGSLASLAAINQNFGKIQMFTLEKDDSLFSKLARGLITKYPNNKHAIAFNENVEGYLNFKRENDDIESRVGISVKAPDIVLPDKDSNSIFLHEFRGKTVLLKFWNPSCEVCRGENLKLIHLYNKYKDFGFEVYEISIGTKKDEWLIVMDEDKTNIWTNVKIPEEGDNVPNLSSYYVWLYGIKSVPYSFLINKDGFIVSKGFKPEDLDKMLQDIFNTK